MSVLFAKKVGTELAQGSVRMNLLMWIMGIVCGIWIDPSVTLKTCYKDKCQREGCKRPGRGALSKYVALACVTKYDG
jgi:hypothetical protein